MPWRIGASLPSRRTGLLRASSSEPPPLRFVKLRLVTCRSLDALAFCANVLTQKRPQHGDARGGVCKHLLRHGRHCFIPDNERRRFEAGNHFSYNLIERAKGDIAAKRNRHDVALVDFGQLSVASNVEWHSRGIPAQRNARHVIHGRQPAASPRLVVQQRAVFEVRIGISRRIIENQTLRELQTIFDGRIGSVIDKVCGVFDVVGSNTAGLILIGYVTINS